MGIVNVTENTLGDGALSRGVLAAAKNLGDPEASTTGGLECILSSKLVLIAQY